MSGAGDAGLAALLRAALSGTGWLDAVIALTLLEGATLLAWHRATGRGLRPAALLPNLLAGLCLMAATRTLLAGAPVAWALAALAGAGLAHAADLRHRLGALPDTAARQVAATQHRPSR